jgi:hypothetical protein
LGEGEVLLSTEVLLVVIAACGTGIISGAIFLRWADHWLTNKEQQVKDINDRLFHSFINVMRNACECFSEYDKKNEDDSITQREFDELVGWAKPIDAAVRPALKFDMVLNRLKVILRRGAASSLIAALTGSVAALVQANVVELAWPEAVALFIIDSLTVAAILTLAFSLFAFFYGIYISNKIDKASSGVGSFRSWKVRSG